jgi:hypothetical protein
MQGLAPGQDATGSGEAWVGSFCPCQYSPHLIWVSGGSAVHLLQILLVYSAPVTLGHLVRLVADLVLPLPQGADGDVADSRGVGAWRSSRSRQGKSLLIEAIRPPGEREWFWGMRASKLPPLIGGHRPMAGLALSCARCPCPRGERPVARSGLALPVVQARGRALQHGMTGCKHAPLAGIGVDTQLGPFLSADDQVAHGLRRGVDELVGVFRPRRNGHHFAGSTRARLGSLSGAGPRGHDASLWSDKPSRCTWYG